MTEEAAPSRQPWHARPQDWVLAALDSSAAGLSPAEAAYRLRQHGPNALVPPKRTSALMRFLAQFRNVLIYVLIGAAAITIALGHWIDAAVILAVVVGNAVIGFIQEGRAESALAAIRGLLAPTASVVRDGRRLRVAAAELVVGDIVHLEGGDRVPADLRLVSVAALRVEEAILTGESVPVAKGEDPVAEDAPLGDRSGMAFSGTLATAGQARGVVVATGPATEIGRISGLIAEVETVTSPLLQAMDRFARWLTGAILALSLGVFLFGWLVRGWSFEEIFFAVVGLAVAAIPEGLPAVLTITLALGVQAMAHRRAIARRLPAVETLGSVSVICTDKTGTLTLNEMAVAEVATAERRLAVPAAAAPGAADPDGSAIDLGDDPVLADLMAAVVLANDADIRLQEGAWRADGDPMEAALLFAATRAGLAVATLRAARPRLSAIPFDSAHRLMATRHATADGGAETVIKGAPDRLLELAVAEAAVAGDRPLDAAAWHARIDAMASRGQRVLGVARFVEAGPAAPLSLAGIEGKLVFLGLVGLEDPPRAEAASSIADCRAAGIRVKMITGDHTATALAIGRRVGLANTDRALTGAALDRLDDAGLTREAQAVDVFARTSPENKLRLVKALQRSGEIVAMTGDGVNDAPALKRAEVGVAMGRRGADAAKEAGAIVLTDDNFATIAAAVSEGRRIYDNLKKSILFILPTNGGQALVMIAAILFGSALPISPVQILWVNLVTAVTLALTLAFEKAEPDVMRRPPRAADEPILSGYLVWRIAFVSVLFLVGVLVMFERARAAGADLETARTVATNALVMFEIVYLFNIRRLGARTLSPAEMFDSRVVLIAVAAVIGGQGLFTYWPVLQVVFDTRPLPPETLIPIAVTGLVVFAAVEAEKHLASALARGLAARRLRGSAGRSVPGRATGAPLPPAGR